MDNQNKTQKSRKPFRHRVNPGPSVNQDLARPKQGSRTLDLVPAETRTSRSQDSPWLERKELPRLDAVLEVFADPASICNPDTVQLSVAFERTQSETVRMMINHSQLILYKVEGAMKAFVERE